MRALVQRVARTVAIIRIMPLSDTAFFFAAFFITLPAFILYDIAPNVAMSCTAICLTLLLWASIKRGQRRYVYNPHHQQIEARPRQRAT